MTSNDDTETEWAHIECHADDQGRTATFIDGAFVDGDIEYARLLERIRGDRDE